MNKLLLVSIAGVALVAAAGTASARPATAGLEALACDGGPPVLPINHELGYGPVGGGPFSAGEDISSTTTTTQLTACPVGAGPGDNPGIANALVSITNHTGKSWTDLWFVADDPSPVALSNFDGLVFESTGGIVSPLAPAFRIDNIGVNVPLVSESILADLIFSPGETWEFIVQDWGLGFPVTFGSLGFPSIGPADGSNASILAQEFIETPAPAALGLLGFGLAALGWLRRRAGG